MRRVPGRLALATVLGNAIFAFLTGVSIAAAAAFTRIAYPQTKAFNYDRGLALGVIAGSSCLGMLIPPSNLMILWAILVEESIGHLFHRLQVDHAADRRRVAGRVARGGDGPRQLRFVNRRVFSALQE